MSETPYWDDATAPEWRPTQVCQRGPAGPILFVTPDMARRLLEAQDSARHSRDLLVAQMMFASQDGPDGRDHPDPDDAPPGPPGSRGGGAV